MQNKPLNIEPVAVPNGSAANILNCAITSLSGPTGYTQTQPYILFRHMRVINTTGSPITVSLWKGATGASASGTEFAWKTTAVPANGSLDWSGLARFDSGDYLVGLAASSGLTLNIDGAEIGLS